MPNQAEYKSVVGVDRVYYALITQDDASAYVVGTPQSLAPAMEIKGTPSSASETQYADNGAFDQVSAEGDTELELMSPNFPESVIAQLLGATFDTATGRVFDDADPSRAPFFALGYRFKKSNGKYRYRWYLKCRAEKPGEEAVSQSDAVNLKTQTLKIRALKTIHQFDLLGDASLMNGVKRVHGDEDTTNFSGANWFNAVQVPLAGTPDAFTLSSVPADAATGVVISANIVLTFSNALAGGAEGGIVLVNADTFAPVAAARTLDTARKVVTLDPTSNLGAATDYIVIVAGVVDIHGQELASTVINFTTA
jgi:phi13 family phage major tail protein